MTLETTAIKGQFLVAMPHMEDPNFHKTVVLICEHNEEGAMGVILNRPIPFTLGQVYEGQNFTEMERGEDGVNFGGPVQPEVGFIVYQGDRELHGSLYLGNGLFLGTSLDLLKDIASGNGPQDFLFALGYAGWGPGQLEGELGRNDWLLVPMDPALIFHIDPAHRWERAVRSLGIDPGLLTNMTGTA